MKWFLIDKDCEVLDTTEFDGEPEQSPRMKAQQEASLNSKWVPEKCTKKRCQKEVSIGAGVYMGEPFRFEPCWLSCCFCNDDERNKEDGEGIVSDLQETEV